MKSAALFHTLVAIRGDVLAGRVLAEFAHPEAILFRCTRFEHSHFEPIEPKFLAALRTCNHTDLPTEGSTPLCTGEVVQESGGNPVRVVIVSSQTELGQLGKEGVLLLQTDTRLRTPCDLVGKTLKLSPRFPNHLRHVVSILHGKYFSSSQREPRSLSEALVAAGVGAEATPAMA